MAQTPSTPDQQRQSLLQTLQKRMPGTNPADWVLGANPAVVVEAIVAAGAAVVDAEIEGVAAAIAEAGAEVVEAVVIVAAAAAAKAVTRLHPRCDSSISKARHDSIVPRFLFPARLAVCLCLDPVAAA